MALGGMWGRGSKCGVGDSECGLACSTFRIGGSECGLVGVVK